jgi:phosphoglycolate phosphatase-like HAD superfamily hydrolase
MIGDSKSDILAGQAAGVKTIFVSSGGGSGERQEARLVAKPDFEEKGLMEAVKLILSQN